MHCELLVPGLLSLPGARAPSLELLLARGRASRVAPQATEAWLQRAFGLPGLPAGALTLLGAGEDAGEAMWARADPVHLRLLRDRAVIAPGDALALSAEEAGALVDRLNGHFGKRLAFRAQDPQRWLVRLEQPLDLPAVPALEVAGRAAGPAREGDALLTEIQMVLHEHPVNVAREARGEPAVNSVWLWGPGAVPRGASARWQSVTSHDPLALGLARAAGLRSRSVASGAAWLDRAPEEGRHLVVLDPLRPFAALGDAAGFTTAVAALEAAWFAPALAALRANRIGMLTLQVPDGAQALSAETIRGDLRRLWRRPRPLATWIG